ncbi:F-box domain, Skp2-like protein [Niveomyces insectorum RCEF 264]|uniref:F-box domain, Skp2-like protein n=1 Tax=Niveomyces insectorum RCEF 264 TaxID=1081102 RepID=A0A167RZD1_9HYPO|nr:F-box domain, Skp2-like protein [Niveomyces insectorum RCEF 264]
MIYFLVYATIAFYAANFIWQLLNFIGLLSVDMARGLRKRIPVWLRRHGHGRDTTSEGVAGSAAETEEKPAVVDVECKIHGSPTAAPADAERNTVGDDDDDDDDDAGNALGRLRALCGTQSPGSRRTQQRPGTASEPNDHHRPPAPDRLAVAAVRNATRSAFCRLPHELLLAILRGLPAEDLFCLRRTCRLFAALFASPELRRFHADVASGGSTSRHQASVDGASYPSMVTTRQTVRHMDRAALRQRLARDGLCLFCRCCCSAEEDGRQPPRDTHSHYCAGCGKSKNSTNDDNDNDNATLHVRLATCDQGVRCLQITYERVFGLDNPAGAAVVRSTTKRGDVPAAYRPYKPATPGGLGFGWYQALDPASWRPAVPHPEGHLAFCCCRHQATCGTDANEQAPYGSSSGEVALGGSGRHSTTARTEEARRTELAL